MLIFTKVKMFLPSSLGGPLLPGDFLYAFTLKSWLMCSLSALLPSSALVLQLYFVCRMGLSEPRPDFAPNASLAPLCELCVDGLPGRKALWYVLPPTVGLHHRDDCFQYETPSMVIRVPNPMCWGQQWFQTAPD